MKDIVQKIAKEGLIVPIIIIGGYIAFGIFSYAIGDHDALTIMIIIGILLGFVVGAVKLEEHFSEADEDEFEEYSEI